jgi:very-short-patch-repair endonuclease
VTESMTTDELHKMTGKHKKQAPLGKQRKKPTKGIKQPSALESKFLHAIQGLPQPVREYRFHPVRRWRFDAAWVEQKVAVEIQGGSWINGGHSRAGHQASDMEKLNTAQLMGWVVLQFNTVQMKDLATVRSVVEAALAAPK